MKALLIFLLFSSAHHVFGQCEVKYEVNTTTSSPARSDGKIEISLSNLSSSVTLELYDLMEKDLPKVAEKRINASATRASLVSFADLKGSTYIVRVKWNNCSKVIGGPEGFRIDQK